MRIPWNITNEKDQIKLILQKCEETNCEFLGFVGGKYKGTSTKIIFKCNKCGIIWDKTTCYRFLKRKSVCPKCNGEYQEIEEDAIKLILKVCEDKNCTFLGFNEAYKGSSTHLKLRCNKCGREWCTATFYNFVKTDKSCIKCKLNIMAEKFKNDIEKVMKNITDKCVIKNYEFLGFVDGEYKNNNTKLILKCNKCGNIWKTTSYNKLMGGKGCPKCHSYKLEEEIMNLLNTMSIEFEFNKYYDFIDGLQLDFYIPSKNIAIECQGGQHFKPVKWFGGEKGFELTVERDNRKRKLCEEHGVKLLYYSNLGINYPYKVYENKEELLNEILKQ